MSSLSLLGRKKPIHIFGPAGIQNVLSNLFAGCGVTLNYHLAFHELDAAESTQCFENELFTVTTIPLDHRIPTNGYLFKEKEQARNIISDKITQYGLSIDEIKSAKAGNDIKRSNGQIVSNEELTKTPSPLRSYAYCSDTRYKPDIIPLIQNVDLLYHETTYLHERLDLAEFSKHTTAKEAGQIAKLANVGRLLIGHYSSRYDDVQPLMAEARSEFNEVLVALNGRVFSI